MTGIERATKRANGTALLAKRLKISKQSMSNWRAKGEPPANKCAAIEGITGVSCRELRKDWADYWPTGTAYPADRG